MSAPLRPGYPGSPGKKTKEQELLELARRTGTRKPLAESKFAAASREARARDESLNAELEKDADESGPIGTFRRAAEKKGLVGGPAKMSKNQALAETHPETVEASAPYVDPWERERQRRTVGVGGAMVLPGGMQPGFQQTERELGVPVTKEQRDAFNEAQRLGKDALELEQKSGEVLSQKQSEVERRIGQENELFRADEMARDTREKGVLNQHRASLDAMRKDVKERKIDPERVAHQRGWLYNLAGRILGAISKDKAGDPNPYIQRLNAEIERDNAEQIREAQVAERDVEREGNLYNTMQQTFKDDALAARALHILKLEALQSEMRRIAAGATGEQAKIGAAKGLAMLEQAKEQQYGEWAKQMSGKTVQTVKDVYQGPKVVGLGGGAGSKEINIPGLGPEPTPEQLNAYKDDYFKYKLSDTDVMLENLATSLGGQEVGDLVARRIATGSYGDITSMLGRQMESNPQATAAYAQAARTLYAERGAALTELEDKKVQQQLGLGTVEGIKAAIDIMARNAQTKRNLLNAGHGNNVSMRFYGRLRNQQAIPQPATGPEAPETPRKDPENPNPGGNAMVSSRKAGVGSAVGEKIRRAREREKQRERGEAR